MRFDADIIRDVLLKIEELLECEDDENGWFGIESISWKEIYENDCLCRVYETSDIKYVIYKLSREGFIETKNQEVSGGVAKITILDITKQGYDILNNIRDDRIFDKIKSSLAGVKNLSVDIISRTASSVLSQIIKDQL